MLIRTADSNLFTKADLNQQGALMLLRARNTNCTVDDGMSLDTVSGNCKHKQNDKCRNRDRHMNRYRCIQLQVRI